MNSPALLRSVLFGEPAKRAAAPSAVACTAGAIGKEGGVNTRCLLKQPDYKRRHSDDSVSSLTIEEVSIY
jgi:hypothetical protein